MEIVMSIYFQQASLVQVYGDGAGSVFISVYEDNAERTQIRLSLTQFSALCDNRLEIEQQARGEGSHK
jgi:hypothetical protein